MIDRIKVFLTPAQRTLIVAALMAYEGETPLVRALALQQPSNQADDGPEVEILRRGN